MYEICAVFHFQHKKNPHETEFRADNYYFF